MDGDKEKQGTSQVGDSSAKPSQTSKETPSTFTKEYVDKAVSDALSRAGRDAKSFETREQAIKSAEDKIVQFQKEREETALEAIRDDPDKLREYRAEQKQKADKAELTEREAKLAKRETEFADIVERDRILMRTQLAAEVAVEKGVSLDAILKLAKEDTREAYLEVAEVLPKATLKPDSSRTIGGGIDLSSLSPKERLAERDRRIRAGK